MTCNNLMVEKGYLKRAEEYVDFMIRFRHLTTADEIENFFEYCIDCFDGAFMSECVSLPELERRVKADRAFAFDAYVEMTNASYPQMWELFMDDNCWVYIDAYARKYALEMAYTNRMIQMDDFEK